MLLATPDRGRRDGSLWFMTSKFPASLLPTLRIPFLWTTRLALVSQPPPFFTLRGHNPQTHRLFFPISLGVGYFLRASREASKLWVIRNKSHMKRLISQADGPHSEEGLVPRTSDLPACLTLQPEERPRIVIDLDTNTDHRHVDTRLFTRGYRLSVLHHVDYKRLCRSS